MNMNDDIAKIIVDRNEIQKTVKKLGERISEDYSGKDLLLVGSSQGGGRFHGRPYKGDHHTAGYGLHAGFQLRGQYGVFGVVKILKDIDTNIKGRHVIIVEDLVDTGLTLTYLKSFWRPGAPVL